MKSVFSPSWGSTTSVTNAIAATAAVALPKNCDQVMLTNTSTTASVNVMVTNYETEPTVPTGTAPTTATGLKVLPLQQVRVHVGYGHKLIRTIASAADGVIEICPGRGV